MIAIKYEKENLEMSGEKIKKEVLFCSLFLVAAVGVAFIVDEIEKRGLLAEDNDIKID
jgi:hypothetical protein